MLLCTRVYEMPVWWCMGKCPAERTFLSRYELLFKYDKVKCSTNARRYSELLPSNMCFSLSPSSSVALKMLIRVSSINNDSGILTSRFKRCRTAPCTRRLTQSFYFYMFSDISKCHSTTTGKERLCHYRSLISSPLFRLQLRHIPDKRRVTPPAHHLSIFWLGKKKKRVRHVILYFH